MKVSIFVFLVFTVCQMALAQEVNNLYGDYSLMSPKEFHKTADGESALYFGANFIFAQGVQAGVLPNTTTFNVSKIYKIYEQRVAGSNYKFDAQLTNADKDTFRATFVVFSQPWTNTLEVVSADYSYLVYSKDHKKGVEYKLVYEEDKLKVTQFELKDSQLVHLDGHKEYIYKDISISEEEDSTEGVLSAEGYTEIDVTKAEKDANIQKVLKAGAHYTVKQSIKKGFLSHAKWTVRNVISIYEQESNGKYYRFDVVVTDGHNKFAEINYVIHQNNENSKFISVVSHSVGYVYTEGL